MGNTEIFELDEFKKKYILVHYLLLQYIRIQHISKFHYLLLLESYYLWEYAEIFQKKKLNFLVKTPATYQPNLCMTCIVLVNPRKICMGAFEHSARRNRKAQKNHVKGLPKKYLLNKIIRRDN